MPKTAITLSDQVAKTLEVTPQKTRATCMLKARWLKMLLRESFERYGVKIEG
jgi:hypothetical protein